MESNKPRYIDPAGDLRQGALAVAPPFVFRAVTSRVFPLKANMARLSGFCDQYLNMDIPPGIAHFRPSLPYVYLMVLNYGSMSAASVKAQNLGWVSQHEMTFTVPLEWWREEHGRLVFKDWACVSPFIWVDDEMSLTTGREVYGWPKVAARVDADVPLWTTNPQSGERVFSLSSCVFPRLYAGEQEVPRVLLQIDRAAAPTYSAFPPDPNNPWAPLTSLADAVRAGLSLTGDALEMLLAPRIRGYQVNRNAGSILAMFEKASGNLAHLLPDLLLPWPRGDRRTQSSTAGSPRLSIEQITLKQFRAVEDPGQACYQALVTSRMGFDRVNQGGLLGDVNLLRGDPSGGFTVRIHRYTSEPIIESLGLDVAAEYEDSGGASVAVLKPTLPFWTDVDLHYGKGRVICSRTSGHKIKPLAPWRDEQVAAQDARVQATAGKVPTIEYNTALGAATEPVCGPFTFPDVTLQVYPLLADRAKLRGFVDRYMNGLLDPIGLRLQTCGAYVYMMVSVCDDQLGSMWSSTNNVGWWAEREVTFAVPVKVYKDHELVSLALLAPFVYANSGRAVISDREVNGRPAVAATIDAPPDAWLTRSGPVAERSMLRLATEMFPALNLGQRAERRTLLEIDERPILPYNADVEWRMVAETWGVQMAEELERKTYEAATRREDVAKAKALALELLANRLPFNWVILKQHRDAAHIDHTCYQAVVRIARSITHIYDAREIETNVHVRVHKSPSHPIVETLGLAVKSIDSIGGCVVQNLQPWRPFWMRIAIEENLGEAIAWRGADEEWSMDHPWVSEPAPGPSAADAPYFRVRGETDVGCALGNPGLMCQNLADETRRWLRKALAHELAWMRANLQALPPDAQSKVRAKLEPVQRDQFDRLQAADPFLAFCDAMQTDAMVGLARALVDAGVGVPSLPALVRSNVELEKLTDAALLSVAYNAVEALPPERRAALELTLQPAQRAQLERLRGAGSVEAYCAATPDDSVKAALFAALQDGLHEWAYHPEKLQRLTRTDARETIDRLDEVQLVIESILSDEWENWGDPRGLRGADRKPEQCVPVGSVYGGSAALMVQMQEFENEHGLKRFDHAWWHVDPPAPKGTRN